MLDVISVAMNIASLRAGGASFNIEEEYFWCCCREHPLWDSSRAAGKFKSCFLLHFFEIDDRSKKTAGQKEVTVLNETDFPHFAQIRGLNQKRLNGQFDQLRPIWQSWPAQGIYIIMNSMRREILLLSSSFNMGCCSFTLLWLSLDKIYSSNQK